MTRSGDGSVSDRPADIAASVVVTTYNSPRTLQLVLRALERQSAPPAEVLVADDGSGPETAAMLSREAAGLRFPVVHVWQPDAGFRLARSRNNALKCAAGPLVAFLDQDVLPHREWLSVHVRHAGPGRVGIGLTLDLPPERAACVTEGDVVDGRLESLQDARERVALGRLHRKAVFYAILRRCGVPVGAKPKLRGNNFAVWLSDARRVNGFDEQYVGWGQEDDDFGRRLYLAGVRPVVLISRALATHLGHGQSRTARWKDGPNVARFRRRDVPVRCVQGLETVERGEVRVMRLGGG